jgi:hypothetical protein
MTIPGIETNTKIKLFTDDTNLFLHKEDRLDYIQDTLNRWCNILGAKFNIEKMEIILVGMPEHRKQVADSRKINPADKTTLPEKIKIACNGNVVRILGVWIGNKTNNVTPWEPILDTIRTKLKRWERAHPTLNGKHLIIQSIVGGHTQFLTKSARNADRDRNSHNEDHQQIHMRQGGSPKDRSCNPTEPHRKRRTKHPRYQSQK